eukprot:gene21817-25892_t
MIARTFFLFIYLLGPLICFGQIVVQGRVLNEDLKPLVCAVANPSLSQKVLTDKNGDFSIKSKPDDTLIFSGIGFTDEIRVVGISTKKINVILMNKQVNCLGAAWSEKETFGSFNYLYLMKLENNKLPDWIERQASLGAHVEVEGTLSEENLFWYLLTVCCPQIFESYAIMLHPFWVDLKLKKVIEEGDFKENEVLKKDRQPVSWRKFFALFNKNFDLSTAGKTKEEIRLAIVKEWPSYIGFPEEGDSEDKQLEFVCSKILEKFSHVAVNFYYCLLKTNEFKEEIIYKGQLSDLELLRLKDDVRDNPTAIFPNDKSWCIV